MILLRGACSGIVFLSLPKIELVGYIGQHRMGSNGTVTSAVVLGDSGICIAGKRYCSIRDIPAPVRSFIQRLRDGVSQTIVKEECIEGRNNRIENDVVPSSSADDNDILPCLTGKRGRSGVDGAVRWS